MEVGSILVAVAVAVAFAFVGKDAVDRYRREQRYGNGPEQKASGRIDCQGSGRHCRTKDCFDSWQDCPHRRSKGYSKSRRHCCRRLRPVVVGAVVAAKAAVAVGKRNYCLRPQGNTGSGVRLVVVVTSSRPRR